MLRGLASALGLLAALIAGGCGPGLSAWSAAFAAALWLAPIAPSRLWLPLLAQAATLGLLVWTPTVAAPSSLVDFSALLAGWGMIAAALRLAPTSPLLPSLVLIALVAPAWSPGADGRVALDLDEGLASVGTRAVATAPPAAWAWQAASAALVAIGLSLASACTQSTGSAHARWRTAQFACLGASALCGLVVVAQAAQSGPWPVLDVGLRFAVVGLLCLRTASPTADEPAGWTDGLVRLAALGVLGVAVLWALPLGSAAGAALPHDPRGWTLAACAIALFGASVRPAPATGAVHGAIAAALLACAAALVGGAAAGWTVADLAQVYTR